jgi:hypothetical protein
VGRDESHTVSFVDALVQGIAVISAVADHMDCGIREAKAIHS